MQGKGESAAQRGEYDRALEGVDFPASKFEILERARDKGGLDHEVIAMLERLPADEYATIAALTVAVREMYIADGPDASALPLELTSPKKRKRPGLIARPLYRWRSRQRL